MTSAAHNSTVLSSLSEVDLLAAIDTFGATARAAPLAVIGDAYMIANAYAEALHHEDTSFETRSRFYDALASVISVLPANRPSDATRLFRLAILAGETVATTSLPQIASAAITLDRHGMLSEESTVKTIISALASLAHAPDAYEALAPMWSRSVFIEAAPFALVRAMCRAAPGRWHEWFFEVLSTVSVSPGTQPYIRTLVDIVGVELIAGSLNQIPDGSFEILYTRLFTDDGAPLILYPDEDDGVYRISSRPHDSAGRNYLASLSRRQIDHVSTTSALPDPSAFLQEQGSKDRADLEHGTRAAASEVDLSSPKTTG